MFFIRLISLLLLTTASGLAAAANPPPSVTASPASCSSVTVTWTAASGNGSSKPSQYEIFRDTAGTSIGTVAATELTFTDTGAGAYSTHIYGVRTKIANGDYSSATWSGSASTGTLCPPGAPANLSATTPSCNQVSLTWTAPAQTGAGLVGYRIYRNNIYITQVTGLTYANTGLAASTSYNYDVSAMDSAGRESAKTRVVATTPSCQVPPPGVPGNLSASTPSCNQASISWTAPTQTGAGLVGYRIYRNNTYVAQVTGLGYSESGLAGSTSYTYEVSAVDSANSESVKASVVATTPDCQAPVGPPGKATLAMHGAHGVVNWPGAMGVRYQAECSTDFGSAWFPVDAPTTSFSVTNLRVGPSVVYRVAWFTNTTEYRNNYASFSSDVTEPAAVSTVTVTELPGARIQLDWSAVADTQSGLKGYLLYRDDAFLAFAPNGVTRYTDATGQGVGGAYDVAAMDRAGNVTARAKPACTFNPPAGSYSSAQFVTIASPAAGASIRYTTDNSTPSPSYGTLYSSPVYVAATTTLKAVAYKGNKTVSAVTTGNYTIAGGCVPPSITSQPAGQTVTAGANVSFSVAASGTSPLGYQWRKNGGNIAGATGSTYSLFNVSTSDAGNYSVVVNNACGSATSFSATLTVNSDCSYSLSPGSSSFGTAGGSGSFIVYTGPSCGRTATPSAGWITITGGGSGSGNGTVSFSVAANTGAARNGTITISGSGPSQSYTVYQDASTPCTYSLTPTNVYFSSANAGGSSIVNAAGGCAWTATSLDGWIFVTGGASGSGSGTVSYSVNSYPSTSSDRVGRIRVVGGATTLYLTINQDRNYAPVANAGANSSAAVGSPVGMDGSGSRDDDGTIVSYSWNFGDGTTGSGVTASHAYSAVGNYTVTLTTTDDLGAASSASKLVTVSGSTGTPGELQFVRTVSSPAGLHVFGRGTAGDHSGNSISVGYFTGSADFGGGTVNSGGSADAFIAKYDSQGRFLWARTTPSSLDQVAYAVTVDSADNILVTGYFYGTVDFGGAILTSVGSADIYLAKYSPAGALVWVKRFGGGATDMGYGVAVDGNNNALIVGYFQGTGDFGSYSLTSAGGSVDIALVKVSATGNVTWAKRYGGNYTEYPNAIATDSAGDVVITGQAGVGGSSIDLGGGTVTGGGIFVAKYSGATGNYAWSKVLGGNAGYGIACDPSTRNVIVTGAFQGTVNFGGGPVAPGVGGGQTMFLAGYSPTGAFLWVNTYGGMVSTSYDQGMGVNFDGSGKLALTGGITSPIDFGGGQLFGGGYFVAAFTVSGNAAPVHHWSKRSTGFGAAFGFGCDFDSSGNVLTSGYFNGTVDFGGLPVTAYGANNAFLCRYAP